MCASGAIVQCPSRAIVPANSGDCYHDDVYIVSEWSLVHIATMFGDEEVIDLTGDGATEDMSDLVDETKIAAGARWFDPGEFTGADTDEANPDVCSRCGFDIDPALNGPDAKVRYGAISALFDPLFDDAGEPNDPNKQIIDIFTTRLDTIEAKLDKLIATLPSKTENASVSTQPTE
jgi:hypothetical protein